MLLILEMPEQLWSRQLIDAFSDEERAIGADPLRLSSALGRFPVAVLSRMEELP